MENFLKTHTGFMQSTEQMLNNHAQEISRIEVQISQLTSSLSERPKGILPSQPLANPKNSSQIFGAQINQYNVVHTLRSRKKVDNQVSQPASPTSSSSTSASRSVSSSPRDSDKDNIAEKVHKPIAPFSNRLRNNNKSMHMEKILEMFN